jgi:hypothetical protein
MLTLVLVFVFYRIYASSGNAQQLEDVLQAFWEGRKLRRG